MKTHAIFSLILGLLSSLMGPMPIPLSVTDPFYHIHPSLRQSFSMLNTFDSSLINIYIAKIIEANDSATA